MHGNRHLYDELLVTGIQSTLFMQVTQNRCRHNSTREARPPNTTSMRDEIVQQISPVGFVQAALSSN